MSLARATDGIRAAGFLAGPSTCAKAAQQCLHMRHVIEPVSGSQTKSSVAYNSHLVPGWPGAGTLSWVRSRLRLVSQLWIRLSQACAASMVAKGEVICEPSANARRPFFASASLLSEWKKVLRYSSISKILWHWSNQTLRYFIHSASDHGSHDGGVGEVAVGKMTSVSLQRRFPRAQEAQACKR